MKERTAASDEVITLIKHNELRHPRRFVGGSHSVRLQMHAGGLVRNGWRLSLHRFNETVPLNVGDECVNLFRFIYTNCKPASPRSPQVYFSVCPAPIYSFISYATRISSLSSPSVCGFASLAHCWSLSHPPHQCDCRVYLPGAK